MSVKRKRRNGIRSFHEQSFNLITIRGIGHASTDAGIGQTEVIIVTWRESSQASLTWKLNPTIGLAWYSKTDRGGSAIYADKADNQADRRISQRANDNHEIAR